MLSRLSHLGVECFPPAQPKVLLSVLLKHVVRFGCMARDRLRLRLPMVTTNCRSLRFSNSPMLFLRPSNSKPSPLATPRRSTDSNTNKERILTLRQEGGGARRRAQRGMGQERTRNCDDDVDPKILAFSANGTDDTYHLLSTEDHQHLERTKGRQDCSV